ncbi:hypothetical protein LOAG_07903, partial [Loa loa]
MDLYTSSNLDGLTHYCSPSSSATLSLMKQDIRAQLVTSGPKDYMEKRPNCLVMSVTTNYPGHSSIQANNSIISSSIAFSTPEIVPPLSSSLFPQPPSSADDAHCFPATKRLYYM